MTVTFPSSWCYKSTGKLHWDVLTGTKTDEKNVFILLAWLTSQEVSCSDCMCTMLTNQNVFTYSSFIMSSGWKTQHLETNESTTETLFTHLPCQSRHEQSRRLRRWSRWNEKDSHVHQVQFCIQWTGLDQSQLSLLCERSGGAAGSGEAWRERLPRHQEVAHQTDRKSWERWR